MNVPRIDLPRVVIVGAGFAGLQFARNINSKNYQVVLLDKNNYHTFQPLLYQVATSGLEPDSIAYPIRKVFESKKHFHFRMTDVHKVNFDSKMVSTSHGNLDYDYLVLATGATTNFFGMKDVEKNSYPMKSLTESLNLRSKILENFEKALYTQNLEERKRLMSFAIVGAGPTGVELAGALAELKWKILPKDYPDLDLRDMQIHLIEGGDRVLSGMSAESSEKSLAFLRGLGVNVWLNSIVDTYDGKTIMTKGNQCFKTNNLIWSAGVSGDLPEFDRTSIEKAPGNRIKTNEFCQIEGFENVYALGDMAYFQSEEVNGYPMMGSVAMQQGKYLGKTFNKLAKNKKVSAFEYKDKGVMATIGRNKAVAEVAHFKFKGIFAWFVWMAVHLMLLVGFRNRVLVFINWVWNYIKYNNGNRLIIRKSDEQYTDQNIDRDDYNLVS